MYPLLFIFRKSLGEGLHYFEFVFIVVVVRSDVNIFLPLISAKIDFESST